MVAALTFLMVALYYFNCMRFLYGYMLLSSTSLLGVLGGIMWFMAVRRWELVIDQFTFFFVLANFALVGVTAIFYQKGLPTGLTQAYLVLVSVIMAWELKQLFPVWTTFALLVALALYDLCAVLTPCGPLKLLVGLVMREGRPLPGLLYEANVGRGRWRGYSGRGRRRRRGGRRRRWWRCRRRREAGRRAGCAARRLGTARPGWRCARARERERERGRGRRSSARRHERGVLHRDDDG